MALPIRDLLWDDWNVEHVARHHVTPQEVEDICFADHWVHRATGRETYALYGQTSAGRYLLVIVAQRGGGLCYPVTARTMTETERRRYQRQRRR